MLPCIPKIMIPQTNLLFCVNLTSLKVQNIFVWLGPQQKKFRAQKQNTPWGFPMTQQQQQ